jgi:hypothetical protein
MTLNKGSEFLGRCIHGLGVLNGVPAYTQIGVPDDAKSSRTPFFFLESTLSDR